MLPSNIGRYKIISELGRGAMGVVYKATDPLLDRTVAIKTLNLSLSAEELEEYEARFYQEARATGKISHPNIVSLYDVGSSDNVAYMAMEYLEGQELRHILDAKGRLPVEKTVDIAAQVAEGLAYAHQNKIIHRDIKPSNIMVLKSGLAKITDFGIARIASSSVRTMTGMVLGSPQYMSPEQVTGKQTDQRTDIFSLGVVLYEMLTGSPPFSGENVHAIMYQIMNHNPVPPKTLNPGVPHMLNYIVAKAMAKDPEKRYQSAADFAHDLRDCASQIMLPGTSLPHEEALPELIQPLPEEEAPPTLGISKSFDSAAATMQLATLTGLTESIEIAPQKKGIPESALIWTGILLFAVLALAAAIWL